MIQGEVLNDSIVKRRTLLWHMGERFAANMLKEQGWTIVNQNWRAGRYEIDIIAMTAEHLLVFVEVKTRITSVHPGLSMYGLESITYEKKQKLVAAAHIYLHHNELVDRGARLDVIVVSYPRKETTRAHPQSTNNPQNAEYRQSSAQVIQSSNHSPNQSPNHSPNQSPDHSSNHSPNQDNPDDLSRLDEIELRNRLGDPVATHIVQAFY